MKTMTIGRAILAAAISLLAAACTEDQPTQPAAGSDTLDGRATTLIATLTCNGNRSTLVVTCDPPSFASGDGKFRPRNDIVLGGQGTFIKLTTSNTTYNVGTTEFRFDMTVQNLIEQPLGTIDGTTLHPLGVHVFIASGPTVTSGTGIIEIVPDAVRTFTAPNQSFYRYMEVLSQNEISAPRGWLMRMPATVVTFNFTLLVAAEVQYPAGYIALTPGPDPLHPGDTRQLIGVVKNANGTVDPSAGPILWSIDQPASASIDPAGLVSGIRGGPVTVTAAESGGSRMGSSSFTITGTIRTWTGVVSNDWSVAGNWSASPTSVVPVPTDSVLIPVVAALPALTQNVAIERAQVADNAFINIGVFDLSSNAGVLTGSTPGSGITGTTGRTQLVGVAQSAGQFSLVRITGTTTIASATTVNKSALEIDAGELKIEGVLVDILNQ